MMTSDPSHSVLSSFLLDVGCGSGLSGECITENGHYWTGCDISKDMLGEWPVAQKRQCLLLG